MNGWKRGQAILALSTLVALGALAFGSFGHGVAAVLALWSLSAGWLIVRLEKKIGMLQRDTLLIRTLNHHRHDWMNDLQVLFGYIGMRKYDILPGYVDKIRAKASSESALSKLGIPSLIVYLLSFRINKRSIVLETEMEQDIPLHMLPVDGGKVANLIRRTVELFDRHAVESAEGGANVLSLQLDMENEDLLLDFVYTGGYRSELEAALPAMLAKKARWAEAEHDFSEEKGMVTIRVPLGSRSIAT